MESTSIAIKNIREHPVLAGLPRWADDAPEMEALAADVQARGIDQPLQVVPDPAAGDDAWLLVDGRHRLRAARIAGREQVPCHTRDEADAIEIVLNSLVQRRHYTKGVLAYICYPLLSSAAENGRSARGANLCHSKKLARKVQLGPFESVEAACARLGFSEASWKRARTIHEKFARNPALRAKWEPLLLSGDLPFDAALKAINTLPMLPHKNGGRRNFVVQLHRHFDLMRGLFLKRWDKLPTHNREAISNAFVEEIHGLPEDLKESVMSAAVEWARRSKRERRS